MWPCIPSHTRRLPLLLQHRRSQQSTRLAGPAGRQWLPLLLLLLYCPCYMCPSAEKISVTSLPMLQPAALATDAFSEDSMTLIMYCSCASELCHMAYPLSKAVFIPGRRHAFCSLLRT